MNKPNLAESFGGASELVFWSFRYFIGRRSARVTVFARQLAAAWPQLEPKDRAIIEKELEQGFGRDDAARALRDEKLAKAKTKEERYDVHLETYLALGDDCDRQAWEQVRAAYRK
jgi:hypothetical protein